MASAFERTPGIASVPDLRAHVAPLLRTMTIITGIMVGVAVLTLVSSAPPTGRSGPPSSSRPWSPGSSARSWPQEGGAAAISTADVWRIAPFLVLGVVVLAVVVSAGTLRRSLRV